MKLQRTLDSVQYLIVHEQAIVQLKGIMRCVVHQVQEALEPPAATSCIPSPQFAHYLVLRSIKCVTSGESSH